MMGMLHRKIAGIVFGIHLVGGLLIGNLHAQENLTLKWATTGTSPVGVDTTRVDGRLALIHTGEAMVNGEWTEQARLIEKDSEIPFVAKTFDLPANASGKVQSVFGNTDNRNLAVPLSDGSYSIFDADLATLLMNLPSGVAGAPLTPIASAQEGPFGFVFNGPKGAGLHAFDHQGNAMPGFPPQLQGKNVDHRMNSIGGNRLITSDSNFIVEYDQNGNVISENRIPGFSSIDSSPIRYSLNGNDFLLLDDASLGKVKSLNLQTGEQIEHLSETFEADAPLQTYFDLPNNTRLWAKAVSDRLFIGDLNTNHVDEIYLGSTDVEGMAFGNFFPDDAKPYVALNTGKDIQIRKAFGDFGIVQTLSTHRAFNPIIHGAADFDGDGDQEIYGQTHGDVFMIDTFKANQPQPIPGDFDNNGAVDFKDFIAFAGHFGGTDSMYDLDKNGSVGFGDFIIFAGNFGKRQAGTKPAYGDWQDANQKLGEIANPYMSWFARKTFEAKATADNRSFGYLAQNASRMDDVPLQYQQSFMENVARSTWN